MYAGQARGLVLGCQRVVVLVLVLDRQGMRPVCR